MENRDLAAVASSCRDAYEFTEENKTSLSSRPFYGTQFALWGKEDGSIVCSNYLGEYEEFGQFEFPIEEDFYDKMALMSVFGVNIRVQNVTLIPRMVEIFKKWNPRCYRLCFDNIHGPDLMPWLTKVEIVEIARTTCKTCLKCDPVLFMEMRDTLIQSPKAGKFCINMHVHEWNQDDIFDNIRPFGGIISRTTPEYIAKFLEDLASFDGILNLKFSRFDYEFVPLEGLKEKTLHVPYRLWTSDCKLLFIQFTSIGYKKYPSWTVQKLPLRNNLCAIVNEKEPHYAPGAKDVDIEIINDNEQEILNCLLKRVEICKDYFTEDNKKRYLEMDDSERLNELLKQHSWHTQMFRSEFHPHCYKMF